MFFGSKAFHQTNLVLVTFITLISFLVILLFDISVRSITQSAVVYSASSQAADTTAAAATAAATAAAAEVTKYQDIENGGNFIPLAYEIFVVNSRVKCRQDIRFASQASKMPACSTFSDFVEVQCKDYASPILLHC